VAALRSSALTVLPYEFHRTTGCPDPYGRAKRRRPSDGYARGSGRTTGPAPVRIRRRALTVWPGHPGQATQPSLPYACCPGIIPSRCRDICIMTAPLPHA